MVLEVHADNPCRPHTNAISSNKRIVNMNATGQQQQPETCLSATTFNGRMATNGSGDRSVNFSQFPSELMNKLAIYKTQDASLIEGGVAGLIELETLRPLDYAFLTRPMSDPLDAKTATDSSQGDIDKIKFDVGVQGNES